MTTEGAGIEAEGFPLADDQATATFPEFMRGLHGLIDDPRWRVACMLYADLMEHPGRDDDRAARVMTDVYLEAMASLDSLVSLVYTRPISRNDGEPLILGAADHLSVRSNVEKTDPRLDAITSAIRQANETEGSARRTM